jgi:hypothetical protein
MARGGKQAPQPEFKLRVMSSGRQAGKCNARIAGVQAMTNTVTTTKRQENETLSSQEQLTRFTNLRSSWPLASAQRSARTVRSTRQ